MWFFSFCHIQFSIKHLVFTSILWVSCRNASFKAKEVRRQIAFPFLAPCIIFQKLLTFNLDKRPTTAPSHLVEKLLQASVYLVLFIMRYADADRKFITYIYKKKFQNLHLISKMLKYYCLVKYKQLKMRSSPTSEKELYQVSQNRKVSWITLPKQSKAMPLTGSIEHRASTCVFLTSLSKFTKCKVPSGVCAF